MKLWFWDKLKGLAPGTPVMLVLGMVSTFFFIIGDAESGVTMVWILLFLFSLGLYTLSFNVLLPRAYTKRYSFIYYIAEVIVVLFSSIIIGVIFIFVLIHDADDVFNVSVANAFFQLIVVAPISWFVYRRYRVGKEELTTLKKELKQSTAKVDLLRSQINPHFLFNVLNTLYGMSLEEKAERTAEGVQRLGDMMRFMLHENMMESIPLAREIEYLRNYITLQRLRTDPASTINIEADVPADVPPVSISPMLLIPFVENAFKHGISFREPSYIKIVTSIRSGTLYFDVSNSIHPKQENDPEKQGHGIGLENVRQRLLMFYPKKHELIVKEGGKDFFVHLTIQLK